jgi:hypothetical protein
MDNAQLLTEHYQKTYELRYEFWKQRNLTFLILLGVIGLATLLTFAPAQTNPLLIDWIAKALAISEPGRIAQLEKSFPWAIVQTLLHCYRVLLDSEPLPSCAIRASQLSLSWQTGRGDSGTTENLRRVGRIYARKYFLLG